MTKKFSGILNRRRASAGFLSPIILTILVLCGCAQSASQNRAPLDVPSAFSPSGSVELPDRWWTSFGDSTLDTLVEEALTSNLTLQSAWDRLDRARAVLGKTKGDIFPSLDLEGGGSTSRFRENGQGGSSRSVTLGLAASYEIDLWGRVSSGIEAAAFDARSAAEDLRTAALSLSAEVASTWYRLREVRGQIAIIGEQFDTNSRILELITLRFRSGQTGIADVLQQRQLIEESKGALAQARAEAAVLEHRLSILIGIPPAPIGEASSGLSALPPLPAAGLPADLMERRPDLRSAWNKVLAADKRVSVAVADRFPRLSITGRVSTSADRIGSLFDDWLATLAGNILGPIVDGGARRSEVERTRAVASEALHDYGQAVLDALAEVEDALAQEDRGEEYLASLDRQLALAEQAVERVKDRYTKGAEEYQRVLSALLSLQKLQRSRLSALRDLHENRIALCRALGGGWEMARPADEHLSH